MLQTEMFQSKRSQEKLGIIVVLAILLVSVQTFASQQTHAPVKQAQVSPKQKNHQKNQEKKNQEQKNQAWFSASYFIDWGVALSLLGGGAGLSFVKPFYRPFRLDDPTIAYKHQKSTISSALAAGLAAGVPLLTFGISQFWLKSGHDFHHAALGLTETLGMTLFLTTLIKNAVGRPRPDFLDRCQPNAKLVCQGDKELTDEGRRSFPSGHSSISFAGGMFLSLYLWGKLKPFDGRGAFWKIPIILAPLTGATMISLTRLSDNQHHWEDILVGAMLGSGFAIIGYALNFPAPWAKNSEQPHNRNKISIAPIVTPQRIGAMIQGAF